MAISRKIDYENVDSLFLDPTNPRLGRESTGKTVTQAKVLELMEDWNLCSQLKPPKPVEPLK